MRIVRDTGNVSLLLPEGIDHVADAPHTLHEAICAGLRWLRFEEHLEADEIPPKRIWLDGERMAEWWAEVERKRKEKYGLDKDDTEAGEDPSAVYEDNDIPLIDRG